MLPLQSQLNVGKYIAHIHGYTWIVWTFFYRAIKPNIRMLSLATTWSAIRPQKRPLRKGRESNLEIQTSAMEVATTQAMDNLVAYTCIWAIYYKSLA